ncbi:MAG: substrate-binding domain-containing protein [Candidatus Edwardsbacteria bacterium]|nr:substrate-binding domain-containing protein [Candidatus Edwardsbacteria bacterium]
MKRFLSIGLCTLTAMALVTPAAQAKSKQKLILATTTSAMDSGLLDFIVPVFEKANNCRVQIIAVGTGAAIRLGRDGNADVMLVHDPSAEEQAVKDGFAIDRRYLMYNDFVLIGPKEDPAGIKDCGTAAVALKKILDAQANFISRADQSGTHKKELRLWDAAKLSPKGAWYLEAGAGMETVLRIANEKRAYCLTDRATYLAHQKELELDILCQGDPELFNPYHVMLVSPARHPFVNFTLAKKFADFLLSAEGQKLIDGFGVDKYGQQLFHGAAGTHKRK